MILHHIGIIMKHKRQMENMTKMLGMKEVARGWIEEYKADCIMFEGNGYRIEGVNSTYGPLENYNNGKGGIHHLAFELSPGEKVPDGIPFLENKTVEGIYGMKVNFIPPLHAGFPIEIIFED